jgi:hypothetical protein
MQRNVRQLSWSAVLFILGLACLAHGILTVVVPVVVLATIIVAGFAYFASDSLCSNLHRLPDLIDASIGVSPPAARLRYEATVFCLVTLLRTWLAAGPLAFLFLLAHSGLPAFALFEETITSWTVFTVVEIACLSLIISVAFHLQFDIAGSRFSELNSNLKDFEFDMGTPRELVAALSFRAFVPLALLSVGVLGPLRLISWLAGSLEELSNWSAGSTPLMDSSWLASLHWLLTSSAGPLHLFAGDAVLASAWEYWVGWGGWLALQFVCGGFNTFLVLVSVLSADALLVVVGLQWALQAVNTTAAALGCLSFVSWSTADARAWLARQPEWLQRAEAAASRLAMAWIRGGVVATKQVERRAEQAAYEQEIDESDLYPDHPDPQDALRHDHSAHSRGRRSFSHTLPAAPALATASQPVVVSAASACKTSLVALANAGGFSFLMAFITWGFGLPSARWFISGVRFCAPLLQFNLTYSSLTADSLSLLDQLVTWYSANVVSIRFIGTCPYDIGGGQCALGLQDNNKQNVVQSLQELIIHVRFSGGTCLSFGFRSLSRRYGYNQYYRQH